MLNDVDYSSLLKSINKGECILFLGAGATASAGGPTSAELAEQLREMLPLEKRMDFSSLAEFVEYCDEVLPRGGRGRTGRPHLEDALVERLKQLQPSAFHELIPRLPWKAIVTTNYDDLVERSYKDALSNGLASKDSYIVRRPRDFVGHGSAAIVPIIKAHGCINDLENAPPVLTLRDYWESGRKHRALYERIKSLISDGIVLFVGYSLTDYNFNNLLFEIEEDLGGRRRQHYFLSYFDIHDQRFKIQQAILKGKGIRTISGSAEDLMSPFADELRHLVLQHRIVPQFSLLDVEGFAGAGSVKWSFYEETEGDVYLRVEMHVSHNVPQSFAGLYLEKRLDPLRLKYYSCVRFEYRFPVESNVKGAKMEFKLESRDRQNGGSMEVSSDIHYLDITPNNKWQSLQLPLKNFSQLTDGRLRRVTIAANQVLITEPHDTIVVEIKKVQFVP